MAGIDMNIHTPDEMDEPVMKPGSKKSEYMHNQVDTELLVEKEQTIQELRETIGILEIKLKKFEQLVKLKDQKIQTLTGKLHELQGHVPE